MGSRGMNNSLQTALSGKQASLQHVLSFACANVLPSTSLQASQAPLESTRQSTTGVSPEMVSLITQTVQGALVAEQASSSASQSTTS